MKKHGNTQIEVNDVRCSWKYENKIVNDNSVLDVFIICQKLHVQVN